MINAGRALHVTIGSMEQSADAVKALLTVPGCQGP